jgi:chorismate--pyruvate lyase
MPQRRYHLIREVLLYAGETPLILARTVLPEPTIKIAQRNLSHLGTRPLGEVIFAYPDLERRQREFSCTTTDYWSSMVHHEFNVAKPISGRRTLYAIHNQPLLVSEFFLPALMNDTVIF